MAERRRRNNARSPLTGFDQWVGPADATLLGFAINGLHNVVHLLIGVLGIAMAGTEASARTYGWILAIVYGLTFLFGLFAAGNDDVNILNLNGADNGLHLVSAIVGAHRRALPRDRDRR